MNLQIQIWQCTISWQVESFVEGLKEQSNRKFAAIEVSLVETFHVIMEETERGKRMEDGFAETERRIAELYKQVFGTQWSAFREDNLSSEFLFSILPSFFFNSRIFISTWKNNHSRFLLKRMLTWTYQFIDGLRCASEVTAFFHCAVLAQWECIQDVHYGLSRHRVLWKRTRKRERLDERRVGTCALAQCPRVSVGQCRRSS